MTEPTFDARRRAEQLRAASLLARGRTHYVLNHGAGLWGVTTALLFSLVMSSTGTTSFWPTLGIALVVFPLGGLVWGAWMWSALTRAARSEDAPAVRAGFEQTDPARVDP